MKPAQDPVDVAEGRAMLDRLTDLYFGILKDAELVAAADGAIACSFELPMVGKKTRTAPTAREAIRAVLIELSEALTKSPLTEWPDAWRKPSHSYRVSKTSALSVPDNSEKGERFQSKARQMTIGVTLPTNLRECLQHDAQERSKSFADVARHLAAMGFEDYDERSFVESSADLLRSLARDAQRWLPSDTVQVMLRMDPSLTVRMRSAAKELSKSASEFGAMCLSHGFAIHSELVALEQRMAAVKGAAVRPLAKEFGLGTRASLLSGVMAGSIRAPKLLLGKLATHFGATEARLNDLFKHSFENRAVPAFKAENGKPQIVDTVASWEQAVRSLKLGKDETDALLRLDA